MIDQSIFKELKQNNIAENPEKVKARIRELWKQNTHKRIEILELAGIKKITVERTYKNGNISAKLSAAMGQILNINPNYLVGAIDEPGVCTDEILTTFLKSNGYGALFEKPVRQKRKMSLKKKIDADSAATVDEEPDEVSIKDLTKTMQVVEETTETEPLAAMLIDKLEVPSESQREYLDALTEDDINLLLKGLILRAKYFEDAKIILDLVKTLLLG